MARQTFQLPGFNGVAPGAVNAQVSLPVGNVIYDAIALSITKNGALVALANLDTDVSEVRLVADSRVLRRFTPAMLLAYLQSKNLTDGLTDGVNPVASMLIPFTDPTRPEVQGQEATALGTADVRQLLLQIDFKAPAGPPVYAVTGVAQARVGAKSVRIFETWQIETLTLVNGVANVNTLATVDDYLGLLIMSGTAIRAKVMVDTAIVYDAFKADAIGLLRAQNMGILAANAFPVYFDATRQVSDALPMSIRDANDRIIQRISTLNIEITDTVAANVKALRRNLWRG